MFAFTFELLSEALSFEAYYELHQRCVAENKTTGPVQSEDLVKYTELNLHRTNRILNNYVPSEKIVRLLSNTTVKLYWVILTEVWCGDAAQNVPVLVKIAQLAGQTIEIKILLRDTYPAVMDAYLTNGGKAIPKLICLDAVSLTEYGVWGPRPNVAQAMVLAYKNSVENEPYTEFTKKLHLWYSKDNGKTLEAEMEKLIETWLNRAINK
jgi:hypothetical protein